MVEDQENSYEKGLSVFEIIILFVGIVLTYFGFNVINHLFERDGGMNWLMLISVFTWLMLLVMFIFLSMGVDTTKRQLKEIKLLKEVIKDQAEEMKLLKKGLLKNKKK
ncbi:MAG: hypothetical protein ACQEP1_03465 [Nanobdellota archaeon]